MKMSTAITVKILQGPIARRFTVPGTVTWNELATNVKSLFPKIAAVEDIQLSYVDDDGDQVIFNTDIELNEALQQAVTTGNKKAVRFWLVENNSSLDHSSAASVASFEPSLLLSAEDGKVPALVPSSEQANEASATVDPTADAVWVLAEPDDEAARKDLVDIATDSKGKQPSENVDEKETVVDYNPFTSVESNVDINIAPTIDVEQSIDDINEALANSLNTADINNQEDDATTKSSSNENTTEADKEEEKEEEEEEETLIEALLSDVLSAVFNLKLGSSEEEEKLQQKREQERQEFLRQQQQQYNQWKAWQEQQRRWQQPNQHLQAAFANFFGLPAQPVYTPRSFRPACNPFVGYMQSQPHSFPTGYPYHNYEQAYSTGCKRRFDAASECSRATRCENAPTTQKAAYVAPDTILCTFGYHIPTNAEASTSKKARNESATSSASTSKQSVLEAVPAAQANVVRNEGTTEEIEAETRSV